MDDAAGGDQRLESSTRVGMPGAAVPAAKTGTSRTVNRITAIPIWRLFRIGSSQKEFTALTEGSRQFPEVTDLL